MFSVLSASIAPTETEQLSTLEHKCKRALITFFQGPICITPSIPLDASALHSSNQNQNELMSVKWSDMCEKPSTHKCKYDILYFWAIQVQRLAFMNHIQIPLCILRNCAINMECTWNVLDDWWSHRNRMGWPKSNGLKLLVLLDISLTRKCIQCGLLPAISCDSKTGHYKAPFRFCYCLGETRLPVMF